jgi:hypothetical protein
VKYAVQFQIVDAQFGTLGDATSPAGRAVAYAPPRIVGAAGTSISGANNDTYLFTVEGMNFGVNSGEGTICKKDGAGCVVLLGQPWSHSSVVFERKPPDWTANDFPGTLSITVGDKTTPKITLVKNPPAFLNETNKALVLESKFDTNGMVDEMRASVPLTVHGVEEASLNTLVINIDMGTPVGIKSLFGCAKGATNCPSDQQGNTTDWTKLNCGYDVDFSQTFCTVLVSIPEGQGENLPLWVVYGSVQSTSIVFGGYNAPTLRRLEIEGGGIAASTPNIFECKDRLNTAGATLQIQGQNFGMAPSFEFCVYNSKVCGQSSNAESCCSDKGRWRNHAFNENDGSLTHTFAKAVIAPGLGQGHLFRISVGGLYSTAACLCFAPPVVQSVTTNPASLPTSGDANFDSPGLLYVYGRGFGSINLGWDSVSRGYYREMFDIEPVVLFATRVLVNGKALPVGYRISEWNDTMITTKISPGEGIDHAVQIETGGSRSAIVKSGRFSYAPPQVLDVNPKFGPTDGSTPITIIGRNFGTQKAAITVTYRFGLDYFSRTFDAARGHKHDHFNITNFPMPAGQGGKDVTVTVAVSGQSSVPFKVIPPSKPVKIVGYPEVVDLVGAYLPPRVDSIEPNEGPTSGCDKYEDTNVWRTRNRLGDTGKIKCEGRTLITLKGSSFGLAGSQGDALIEMRSLKPPYVWDPIATSTDGNIVEHTHSRLVFNAPKGLGKNRTLRLYVGGQTLPNNVVSYHFRGPSDSALHPNPVNALGGGDLEITAKDGFGETNETLVVVRLGGKVCRNATWQPQHSTNGRPYITCTPPAGVAGSKSLSFDVGESTGKEEPVNGSLLYSKASEIFAVCMSGETDLSTGKTQTYYGRPCNGRERSLDASKSVLRTNPCASAGSGGGEVCLPCPTGATCLVPGRPFPENRDEVYMYFDPIAMQGFWRSALFLDSEKDLAEIESREYPRNRYNSMKAFHECRKKGVLACDNGCTLVNQTVSVFDEDRSGTMSMTSMPTCASAKHPNIFDKGFVFDFLPCEPSDACLGENECAEGYKGYQYACDAWYESTGIGSRSCRTNRDCMTKSGNSDVLSQCSSSRPQDCAVCNMSAASADGVGRCECTAGPRCGRCTLGGKYGSKTVKSYYRMNGACEKCPENVALIIALFFVAIFFFLVGASWLSEKNINMAFIPIGVDYFQVLAIFTGSNIPWPSYLSAILQFFSFFNVNIDITAPECIAPNLPFAFKFYLTLMTPVVALCLMAMLMACKIFKQMFCKSCFATGLAKFNWRSYISVFLIIVYFLYLTVTRRALQIFTCNPTTPDDGFFWSTFSDPACPFGLCRCYDAARHDATKDFLQKSYVLPAVVFLGIYTAGFPVLVAVLIRKNKKQMKQDQLLRAYGLGNTPDQSTDNIWRARLKYKELCRSIVCIVVGFQNKNPHISDPSFLLTIVFFLSSCSFCSPCSSCSSCSSFCTTCRETKIITINLARSTGSSGLFTENWLWPLLPCAFMPILGSNSR